VRLRRGLARKREAVSLLRELREECRDWQEALCGERDGLDELCARVDGFLSKEVIN
jgi:hypothetical protein